MNKRRKATQRRQISLPLCSRARLPLIPPYLSALFPPFCLCSVHPGEAVRRSQWDRGSGDVFGGGLGGEGGVISIWHQTQTIEQTNEPTNKQQNESLSFISKAAKRDEKGDASPLYMLPTSCPPFRWTLDRAAQWVALGVSKPIPFRCRETKRVGLVVCLPHVYIYIYTYTYTCIHTHHTYTSSRKLSGFTWPSLVLKFQNFEKQKTEQKNKKYSNHTSAVKMAPDIFFLIFFSCLFTK